MLRKVWNHVTTVLAAVLLLGILLSMLLPISASADETGPDPNFHIYLAFGQSNTVGWGGIAEQDLVENPRFLVMGSRNNDPVRAMGEWYTATPPFLGGQLSYLTGFGKTMVENLPEPVRVGVIVVAVNGCKIQLFEKENYQQYLAEEGNITVPLGEVEDFGGNPYQRLLMLAQKAQQDGVIKGILLHQGEANVGDTLWATRVKGVYESLLQDLGLSADEVPLLAGETVPEEHGGAFAAANQMIAALPNTIPTAHVISSAGLSPAGNYLDDYAHFNAESCRELGRRYAEKMLEMNSVKVHTEIKVNKESVSMAVGRYDYLLTSLSPTGAGNLEFSSSDTSIIKCNNQWHTIQAIDEGEAEVIIRFAGRGYYAPCERRVPVTVTGPAWNEPTYSWSIDHKSCTAERTHRGTSSKDESETVNVTPVVTPATCKWEGQAVYTASFQNPAFTTQTYTETLSKLPHTPGTPVHENEVAATCTAAGSYEEVVYCSSCGEELRRTPRSIDKLAHTPGTAVHEHEVAATCTAAGSYEEVVYCSSCGEELSRTPQSINKLAHTPGTAVQDNEVAATCTATGSYEEVVYCSSCGEELSRTPRIIDKLAHTPGTAVRENEIAPTYTSEGSYDEVLYCAVCGEQISRTSRSIPQLQQPGGDTTEGSIAVYGMEPVQSVSLYRYLQPTDNGAYAPGSGWESFFRSVVGSYLQPVGDPPQPRVELDGVLYTLAVTEDNAARFAADLMNAIRSGSITPSAQESADGSGQASWTQLPLGGYIVYPEGCLGSLCLLTQQAPSAVILAKSPTASLEKTAQSPAGVDAGQYVSFRLRSTVPDISGYGDYLWQVQDVMDAGLAYDPATAELSVTVGGADLSNYTVTALTLELGGVSREGFSLRIPAASLQGKKDAEILITYRARLTEQAICALTENRARLCYGESTASRETPWVTATVWSNRIVVDKHAADAAEQKLPGAQFVLARKIGGTESFCKIADDGAVTWVTDVDEATVRTTGDSGAADFSGLGDGMYWLREIQAPDGYAKLTADIGIQLQGKADENADGKLVGASFVKSVENRAGAQLPSTGGMGTESFTAMGGALMGMALWLLLKRRREEEKGRA